MKRHIQVTSLLGVLALAGCTDSAGRNTELRTAVDSASISLKGSVGIAETSIDGARAVRATLLTKSKVLSIHALSTTGVKDVRVDPSTGVILASQSTSEATGDVCTGSLAAIIDAAEQEVGGDAVFAGPDDDGGCNTEVKVLDARDTLWEVKVDAAGEVLEQEVADDAAETNE